MSKNYSNIDLADGLSIKTDNVHFTLEETSNTYSGVDAVLASNQNVHIIVDSDGNDANTGGFTIRTNGSTIDTAREVFKVSPNGLVTVANTYSLPTSLGTLGSFLITDGAGGTSWSSIGANSILTNKVINIEPPIGSSIVTNPVITNALATIGTTNGYVMNIGFGEYRETGPIVFNEKWQLNVVGVRAATTTSATIKNGVTVSNSNGVRFTNIQVEGTTAIASRAGLGNHFQLCQFMGNTTISGTGGFLMFVDCDFGGNVTIDAAYAGTVYFVRCSFSSATATYSFNQTSAVQAIIYESSGIPNTSIAKAAFSGTITYKNGSQALFLNGIPITNAGATSGQVLKFNGVMFAPAADNATDATKVPLAGGTMTGLLTLSGAPTANNHAATKTYVDGVTSIVPAITQDANTSGGAQTFTLTTAQSVFVLNQNGAAGNMIVNLPATATNGKMFTVKYTGNGAPTYTCTVGVASSGKIDNSTSGVVISTNNEVARFIWDSTKSTYWKI